MRHYPFKELRQVVTVLKAEAQLLLAIEGLTWSQNDHVMFFVMNEMTTKTLNGTSYTQMWAAVMVWHRYFKRLIDQLPEGSPIKISGVKEYQKIELKYPEIVEVQSLKS